MSQTKSTKCYIEEYETEPGHVGLRLREKATGRKVNLGTTTAPGKQHFVQFLAAAGAFKTRMPDIFSRDGDKDCILVSGDLDFDAPDEIRYIHNDQLSYLFD
ncbi:hypothetical protein [Arthrobacter sp. MMS18-M83]|uniref:hypothetical protein n=1 Tax=Arthrobacter sp. MMS18-M83 TaxID=2996261 RepID=UPI00227A61C1|nr:hypothetical protein [Arthrobacter sp. MMS18-M83]WAH99730.1 hypothetical protein OW521_24010 [Arthrobacter sp. MMS18-M83]